MGVWPARDRGDIAAILHEVQAHNTTLGAAGPTAGMPHKDKQHHKGARTIATPKHGDPGAPERRGQHDAQRRHQNSACLMRPSATAAPDDAVGHAPQGPPRRDVRRQRTQRALGIALAAGVAAAAFWLQGGTTRLNAAE